MKNIKIFVDELVITYNKATDTLQIAKNTEILNGDPDNMFFPPDDDYNNDGSNSVNMLPHDSKRVQR